MGKNHKNNGQKKHRKRKVAFGIAIIGALVAAAAAIARRTSVPEPEWQKPTPPDSAG